MGGFGLCVVIDAFLKIVWLRQDQPLAEAFHVSISLS